jgi:hypothetical protein
LTLCLFARRASQHAELLQQATQHGDRLDPIGREGGRHHAECAERVSPFGAQIRLHPASHEIGLSRQESQEVRPYRCWGLPERRDRRDAIPWEPTNREEPLTQRCRVVSLREGQLRYLGSQRVRAAEARTAA